MSTGEVAHSLWVCDFLFGCLGDEEQILWNVVGPPHPHPFPLLLCRTRVLCSAEVLPVELFENIVTVHDAREQKSRRLPVNPDQASNGGTGCLGIPFFCT